MSTVLLAGLVLAPLFGLLTDPLAGLIEATDVCRRLEPVPGRLGIVPSSGGATTPLGTGGAQWPAGPQWSAEGSRICFTGYLSKRPEDADIFTMRGDGTDIGDRTSAPSNEWGCHWFDHDRYLWLVSDRPDFDYSFGYYVRSSGGRVKLFPRG